MNHLNTNAQAPSARALAYQALYDILEKGAYSNLRLQTALKKNHLKIEKFLADYKKVNG